MGIQQILPPLADFVVIITQRCWNRHQITCLSCLNLTAKSCARGLKQSITQEKVKLSFVLPSPFV